MALALVNSTQAILGAHVTIASSTGYTEVKRLLALIRIITIISFVVCEQVFIIEISIELCKVKIRNLYNKGKYPNQLKVLKRERERKRECVNLRQHSLGSFEAIGEQDLLRALVTRTEKMFK